MGPGETGGTDLQRPQAQASLHCSPWDGTPSGWVVRLACCRVGREGAQVEITKQDIRDLKEELVAQMADGFGRNDRAQEQINRHLATLNGRVGKGETERATMGIRLGTLEREIGEVRRKPAEDAGENRRLRLWDLWIAVGSMGLLWVALNALGLVKVGG